MFVIPQNLTSYLEKSFESKWKYPLLVFLVIFIIRYPISILTLDVTDQGFHLANQALANAIGLEFTKMFPCWWFSDVVGAYWLKITEGYGLWGARLGGTIANSLTAMLSMRMISMVYRPTFSLFLVILGAALYSAFSRVLCYANVPALIFVCFGISFLKLIQNPTRLIYSLWSGLLLCLLILSKRTMIFFLFIPLFSFLSAWVIDRLRARAFIKPFVFVYGIIFLCLIALGCYFKIHGVLLEFLVTRGPAQEHEYLSLFLLWYRQLRTIVPLLILFFGIPVCYFLILRNKNQQVATRSVNIFLSLFALSMFLSFFRSKWFCPFADINVVFIITYLLGTLISGFCVFCLWRSLSIEEFALFLMAIAFPFAQTVFSGTGFGKASEGMWILGGVMLHLLHRLGKTQLFMQCGTQLSCVCLLLNIITSWYGVKCNYLFAGRDSTPLTALTSGLQTPTLKGIYTNSKRKTSVDALIQEMGKYTQKGDRSLIYFHLPLLYFASSTLPLGNHPWLGVVSVEELEKKIKEFSSLAPPKVIVRSKTDKMNPNWGLTPCELYGYCRHDTERYAQMLLMTSMMDRAVNELWSVDLVWSNPDFELFVVR